MGSTHSHNPSTLGGWVKSPAIEQEPKNKKTKPTKQTKKPTTTTTNTKNKAKNEAQMNGISIFEARGMGVFWGELMIICLIN